MPGIAQNLEDKTIVYNIKDLNTSNDPSFESLWYSLFYAGLWTEFPKVTITWMTNPW